MKHLFSIIAMMILITPAFGQLQVKSESSEMVFKCQWMAIQKVGEGYDMLVTDTGHTGSMIIHLGDSLEQSIATYKQIGEWFTSAEKKATLTIADKKGNDLTFYKQNESTWMVTEGDGEYARKFFNDAWVKGLTGSGNTKKDIVSTPKVGYVKRSHFSEEKIQQIFYGVEPTIEESAE